MFKKQFGLKDKQVLANLTLDNIETKMIEMEFTKGFIEEIMTALANRFDKCGKEEFQEWFYGLNYQLPAEFDNEELATKMYEKHSFFIEEQVKQLEIETTLSWQVQAEDLKHLNKKASKVQLVIRDRLSSIALDLLNN